MAVGLTPRQVISNVFQRGVTNGSGIKGRRISERNIGKIIFPLHYILCREKTCDQRDPFTSAIVFLVRWSRKGPHDFWSIILYLSRLLYNCESRRNTKLCINKRWDSLVLFVADNTCIHRFVHMPRQYRASLASRAWRIHSLIPGLLMNSAFQTHDLWWIFVSNFRSTWWNGAGTLPMKGMSIQPYYHPCVP